MLCAIPIETLSRELDGALYLALHLAKESLPTLIGERMVGKIIRDARQPVILFDNDHVPDENQEVLDLGGRVLSIHPEGINIFDAHAAIDQFTEIAEHVSYLCVWGQAQADLVRKHLPKAQQQKVIGTGHPAYDLANELFNNFYTSKKITDRHNSDYILINTNFSYHNNHMGFENWFKMISNTKGLEYFKEQKQIDFAYALKAYQEKLIEHFVALTIELSERFPARHIIIRPHPSESPQLYKDAFRNLDNVFVNNEGSVRSWIASAGCVIHHDCTTGIEALLQGKTVINFRPIFDESVAASIPCLAGAVAMQPSEVVEYINAPKKFESLKAQQLNSLEPYFATIRNNASKALAKTAASYESKDSAWVYKHPTVSRKYENFTKYCSRVIKSNFPKWFYPKKRNKALHALSKFSLLTKDDMEQRINALRAVEPVLPLVSIKKLCLNTYLILPTKPGR